MQTSITIVLFERYMIYAHCKINVSCHMSCHSKRSPGQFIPTWFGFREPRVPLDLARRVLSKARWNYFIKMCCFATCFSRVAGWIVGFILDDHFDLISIIQTRHGIPSYVSKYSMHSMAYGLLVIHFEVLRGKPCGCDVASHAGAGSVGSGRSFLFQL